MSLEFLNQMRLRLLNRGDDPHSEEYQRIDQLAYRLFCCCKDENQYYVIHYGQYTLTGNDLDAFRQQVLILTTAFTQATAQNSSDPKFFKHGELWLPHYIILGLRQAQELITSLVPDDKDAISIPLKSAGKVLQTLIEFKKTLQNIKPKYQMKLTSFTSSIDHSIRSLEEIIAQAKSKTQILKGSAF